MFNEIKKGLLSGIGAVVLTREKAEEVTRKLVKDAKLSREDAEKLVNELMTTGEQHWARMEESFSKAVRKGLDNLDIGSRKELHGLKSRVGKLEKRIKELEQLIDTEKDR